MHFNKRLIMKKLFIFFAFITLTTSHNVFSQADYPNRAIKIIVPYATGGSTDVYARIIAQKLTENYKSSVIVENKPGGNTLIGTEFVAKSASDGYTLLVASSGNAVNPSFLGKKAEIFPKDFVPIIGIAVSPNLIAVNSSTPYLTIQELISAAKANPGKVSYANSGTGSLQHIVGEQFILAAKINMTGIPYKGGGPATADVMAGHVPVLVTSATTALPLIRDGRLRALAVTSDKRLPQLPSVPTLAESGFPDFNGGHWVALYAPLGTPKSVVDLLNNQVNSILIMDDIKQRFNTMAAKIIGGTPQDLEKFVESDMKNMSSIIRDANIKID
jgi:tripartite-type tricarboxylate transporter receptor subunit TctC